MSREPETWCGKVIADMTREELLEAFIAVAKMLDETQRRNLELHSPASLMNQAQRHTTAAILAGKW